MKQKFLPIIALLLMAATGAWAQTETLLTTITATGQTTYSETTPGVVTVTHDNDDFNGDWGWIWWHAGSLTVEAKDGYTITKCVFRQKNKSPFTVSTAPFKVQFIYNEDLDNYNCEGADPDENMDGVTSIEVYGPAAPAATGYSVTLADGTEEAGNWKAKVGNGELQALPLTGLTGDGTETVTITYTGTKRVKSVKAVKKEVIKPDLLSGVFSVSSTKKVNFSKGNLQATYDGSSWTWAFANNQWDYIGKAAGNTKVTDASPFISENGTVDYFGWVGASSTWDGVNQYGITSSDARNATNGYGNSATENLKYDWGTLKGTGWRTLTKDEWDYMLNSRSGTRYCKAQVNSKSGLVIFPDGYSHPTGPTAPTAPTNTNTTDAAYTTNSWSGEAWTKMENAGCVFLPAAGYRSGNSVSYAGTDGYYWSNGASDEERAFCLTFRGNYLSPEAGSYRNYGRSVRLVKDK